MKTLLFILGISVSALAQTASYPSSIATSADMKVAANNVSTSLRSSVTASDTVWTLADTSRITVNMLLSCEKEVVSVTSVNGSLVTVVRGFDSTTAAAHATGKVVENRPVAWDKNKLAAEITAIETALGVSLSNVSSNGSAALSTLYDFPAQTPGGSLVIGANSITLSPVPAGVNGTNTGHRLRVSGGTGTAESCLIIGGSATSGSASGTLIIQCANTHSGAWTIRSATAGIQEALYASSGVPVRIPGSASQYTIYAPITIYGSNHVVSGDGMGVTTLATSGFTTQNIFEFSGVGQFNVIQGLNIECQSAQAAGYAIYAPSQNFMLAQRFRTNNCPGGVYLNSNVMSQVSDARIENLENSTGVGVYIGGPNGFAIRISRVITDTDTSGGVQPLAGIQIQQVGDVTISGSHLIHNKYGLLVNPGNGQYADSVDVTGDATYFDNNIISGVLIQPSASGGIVERARFDSSWISSSATSAGISFDTTTNGGTIDGVTLNNCQIYDNATFGLYADGSGTKNIRVYNSVFTHNSKSSGGTYPGALFNISKFTFNENKSGLADSTVWPATQSFGVSVYPSANDNYSITNNDFNGNLLAALDDQGTGLNKVVSGNVGVDNAFRAVASASTISLNVEPTYIVSGTTGISNINGGYYGRQITLIPTNASPGGLLVGGNIATVVSMSQNVPVTCRYSTGVTVNGGWYCK